MADPQTATQQLVKRLNDEGTHSQMFGMNCKAGDFFSAALRLSFIDEVMQQLERTPLHAISTDSIKLILRWRDINATN
jgi:hypothetical protein